MRNNVADVNSFFERKERLEKQKLRKVMGFWDLVPYYIVTVVSLRYMASATSPGPSVLLLWIFAFLTYCVPLALSVAELSNRFPEEGGLYVWVKQAFGDFHGFVAAWHYWISLVFVLPGILLWSAANFLQIVPDYAHLSEDKTLLSIVSIASLSISVVLNLLGLRISKWLHNVGVFFGLLLPLFMVVSLAVITLCQGHGSATEFTSSNIWIRIRGLDDLLVLSLLTYAFAGLESASIMSEEVRDSKRTIPRALLTSSLIMLLGFIMFSASLLICLKPQEISGLTGISDSVRIAGQRMIGSRFGQILASLMGLSLFLGIVGTVSGWVASNARLPFVMGLDEYLPAAFGRLNPKWRSPVLSLLTIGGSIIFLILLSNNLGSTAEKIFEVTIYLDIVTVFICYLYMFAALIVLQKQGKPREGFGIFAYPYGAYLMGSVGFLVTLTAMILGFVSGEPNQNRIVLGVFSVNLAICMFVYFIGKRRRLRTVLAINES